MDEDYPRTLLELERRFCTEEACVEYLAALRWPGGWVCHGVREPMPGRFGGHVGFAAIADTRCRSLRDHLSGQSCTSDIWFRAMWQITSQKNA